VRIIVFTDQRYVGTTCLVTDDLAKHAGYGDEVRWISKSKTRITIDINGTSPLARGHFELAPGGSDGGIVTYDSGQLGNRTFYYSVFPRNCTGANPAIVVDGKRK
jgi:hypothetical protein